ncbi:MAG: hypothetical protein F4Z23_05140, partial [Acidimicrobiaceae bacterium]|nr:hypothetical protein [Acidimicrobiaceae bacterium]
MVGYLRSLVKWLCRAAPALLIVAAAAVAGALAAAAVGAEAQADTDAPGSASIAPAQARVDQVLRASVSDPDGIGEFVGGIWQRSDSLSGPWETIPGTGESSAVYTGHRYTPVAADVGKYLRVEVRYKDSDDVAVTGATAVLAAPVLAAEAVPELAVVEHMSGLDIPWGIAFTPDGTMLVTERGGRIRARLSDGTVNTLTADLSDLAAVNEAGLMGIEVHPDYGSGTRRIYTCQTQRGATVSAKVVRWDIDAAYTAATRVETTWLAMFGGVVDGRHSGCRLRFDASGHLWIGTGDASVGTNPQNKSSLAGKVLRVDAATGAGVPGNGVSENARVYSWGHRNVQGLALRPGTTQMWAVEHGPAYDDEINLLSAGANYGWDPVPGYNQDVPMTDLAGYPDAVAAKWSSSHPSLAPSGGAFITGTDWGAYNGRLAVAFLKERRLRIFGFSSTGTLESEVLVAELDGAHGRLRTPVMGPEGALYVSTSNGRSADKILRVSPQAPPAFASETLMVNVSEDAAAGTAITTLEAVDPNGQALVYSLSGADRALFSLHPGTGRLSVAKPLDYETRQSHLLTVTATDPLAASDTLKVTVNVTDVDEPPPPPAPPPPAPPPPAPPPAPPPPAPPPPAPPPAP